MGTLWQDLKYGARMLARNPGFTAVAVLTLALGIGANTAIFSLVNAALLRPLPYPQADQLVAIWGQQHGEQSPISPANFLDWQQQARGVQEMAALRYWSLNLAGEDHPERALGAVVSTNFFHVLGTRALVGRTFHLDEDGKRAGRAVVLSQGLWQRRYGSNPAIVGHTIRVNGESLPVVGVVASAETYPIGAELWVTPRYEVPESTVAPDKDLARDRGDHYLMAIGRLRPGVGLKQANADLATVTQRLERQYPDTNAGQGAALLPLREELVGPVRLPLLLLLGAVGLVLLIACSNVANMFLARATGRQRELAVRVALGASRMRLVRQLVVEALTFSIPGALLGLLLAAWLIPTLGALGPSEIRLLPAIPVDATVLTFTVLAALGTGLVFGVLPAARVSRLDLQTRLKEGGRGITAHGREHRLRSGLVVSEVALALLLLLGAGLLLQSLERLVAVPPGFEARGLLTFQLWLPQTRYHDPARRAAFEQAVLEQVRALPGVESAAVGTRLPLSGGESVRSFQIAGRPSASPEDYPAASYRAVSADYFRTLKIPVLRGRTFKESDAAGAPGVAIISQSLARRYWPNQNPLGRRLRVDNPGEPLREIVGIVGDVRHQSLDADPSPTLYVPYPQDPWPFFAIVVRAGANPEALIPAATGAVQRVDPEEPVFAVRTMEQALSLSVAGRRLPLVLLGAFAVLALVLTVVGIYGVMSYTVAERTHEIGVRMALGAQATDVLRLVLGRGLKLVLSGVGLGLLAALLLTRLLISLLFGVSSTDAATFAAAAILLSVVALLACYIPARRAARVDPMVALRYE